MYEELVKRIRGCSYSDPNGCEECRDCPNAENYYECKQILALQAADAIEALVGKVQYLIERCDMADKKCAEATHLGALWKEAALEQKPRWIPVTELLPEEIEGLNWHDNAFIRCTSVWCCNVNAGTIGVRNRLQGKKTGIAYFDTEWHWSNAWWERWEPTHWMPIVPLPEPPKEET